MAELSTVANDEWVAEGDGTSAVARPVSGLLRRVLTNPYLTLISRLVLGGIFLLAGLTKLGVPTAMIAAIDSYEMSIPYNIEQFMANTLPPLEVGLGIWILVGLFTRISAAVAGGLVVIFLIAMVYAMMRGIAPECGCFAGPQGNPTGLALLHALGPLGTFLATETVGAGSILRDLLFLLMSIHLILVPSIFSIDSWRRSRYQVVAEAE